MAHDAGRGVLGGELLQQLVERVLLGLGAGVGSLAVLIESALIDDAQRTVVVVAGMHALHTLGQHWDHITIAAHIVVVRALAIFGLAAGFQVLHAERAVALVGYAVHNQELHVFMLQWLHN